MPAGKSKKRRGVFRGNSEWGKLMAARRVALQTAWQRSESARRAVPHPMASQAQGDALVRQ
jgi:hypothetical protein